MEYQKENLHRQGMELIRKPQVFNDEALLFVSLPIPSVQYAARKIMF